ncbi:hypothetical protein [Pseudonocardia dioxanivorans]|uniref:hypothetical protein n=1 Tax=Pseudonocardia dioxanivorans TaxID=240495 RepID=UPI0002EF5986|nr:hypothetical protein [Pseudonocardia dioxanivorans]
MAIGALHTIVRAAATEAQTEDDRIRVDLGNPGKFSERRAIGVGLSAVDAGPIDDRDIRKTLGYDVHAFDIACIALAWSGDENDKLGWMTKAYDLVDVVRAALEDPANRGLGIPAVVQSARIAGSSFSWRTDGQAAKAVVEFPVRINALRLRR